VNCGKAPMVNSTSGFRPWMVWAIRSNHCAPQLDSSQGAFARSSSSRSSEGLLR
jgi:hypothetical protein